MDSESSYEDPGAEDQSSSDIPYDERVSAPRLNKNNWIKPDYKPLASSKLKRKRVNETQEERWQRLREHYNDHYLSILNEVRGDGSEAVGTDLVTSQLGSVTWSELEKEKFFCALSRKSKADVRGIATKIGSKSELEVYDYLQLLEEEDRDRQLYAEDASNVSATDIPVAAEVSEDCEALLENAADALSLYQDRFDHAAGEQMHHDLWLIDSTKAESLDKVTDDAEASGSLENQPVSSGDLFRLSSWVSLTEQIFMKSRRSEHGDDGFTNAARDEVPAITQDAIADFYELASCRLRKIIQTSIFCAESRACRVEDRGHMAKAWIKRQDVATATELLAVKEDWLQFWAKLARRNQLQVLDDRRRKGHGRVRGRGRDVLREYDEVERILNKISLARQRHRSASSASGSRFYLSTSTMDESLPDAAETDAISSDLSVEQHSQREGGRQDDALWQSGSQVSTGRTSPSSRNSPHTCDSSNEDRYSTDEEDGKLEMFDQAISRRAEHQLYHDLGWTIPESTQLGDGETNDPPKRRMHRRSAAECQDWRDSIQGYTQCWEEHDEVIDKARFMENQRAQKRRRVDLEPPRPQDLPFRVTGP